MKKVFSSSEIGASYVELSISIVIFMMIIISVIELLKFSFDTVTTQYILQESLESATKASFPASEFSRCPYNARILSTDQIDPYNRASCIVEQITFYAEKIGLEINPNHISISGPNDVGARCRTSNPLRNAGMGGEIVTICITMNRTMFSWFSSNTSLQYIVFGRNENYRLSTEVLL